MRRHQRWGFGFRESGGSEDTESSESFDGVAKPAELRRFGGEMMEESTGRGSEMVRFSVRSCERVFGPSRSRFREAAT